MPSHQTSVVTVSQAELQSTIGPGSNNNTSLVMPIPSGIQHTLTARLVTCEYTIEVIAVTEGCCVSNATLVLPVKYVQICPLILIYAICKSCVLSGMSCGVLCRA